MRVRSGTRTVLTPSDPVVTLSRVQSGVGTLTFEAKVSDAVGDLRLGAAYQLRSGECSTVQHSGGRPVAAHGARHPVVVADRERFERLQIDLRKAPDLDRLVVYAFSDSRAALAWGGTLVVTTYADASIELPLETLQGGDVAVVMSLYNVDGEFVLRAEMQSLYGYIRAACRAYGFDRITWLDDKTPVDP